MIHKWHRDGWDKLRNASRFMVRKTFSLGNALKPKWKKTKAVFKNKIERFYSWHPDPD